MLSLDEAYLAIGRRLWAMGVPCDDSPNGPVANWIRRRVKHREGTLFFIVLGVTCAMADIEAQIQGFEGNIDRACKLAFAKRSA